MECGGAPPLSLERGVPRRPGYGYFFAFRKRAVQLNAAKGCASIFGDTL
jgi:hypothetical protein